METLPLAFPGEAERASVLASTNLWRGEVDSTSIPSGHSDPSHHYIRSTRSGWQATVFVKAKSKKQVSGTF
ncbi:hypothetical protein RBWH47_02698 [Rhodopirellula baltica WH47]|uniref:Uncharacterized protein n=1 Tax=Rhodopirellula baltica WH47 TaxID=991778 RepID=F2B1J7_RHOBT|nr:hypothetical protein RBWH47_02698 [Rhodopirellula baltica WH47]